MGKTNLGAVTAYADAVKHGYTGSREEFAQDQANFAKNAQKVAEDREAVEKLKTDIEGIKDAAVDAVGTAKNDAVTAIENAGVVERAALGTAAEEKTAEVEAQIEAKGAEVVATIPPEYLETVEKVNNLSEEIGEQAASIDKTKSLISRNDKRITNLEKRIEPEPYYEDDTVAYAKDVPVDALPYAEVGMVGGMTRKSTNLWNNEKAITSTTRMTKTETGFTYVSGANTGAAYYLKRAFYAGESVTFSCKTKNYSVLLYIYKDKVYGVKLKSDTNKCSYTFDEDTPDATFAVIINSTDGDNEISNIAINPGLEALPYELYFEGLRSAPVTEVKSVGVDGETVLGTLPIPEAVRDMDGYGEGNPENPAEFNDIVWQEDGKRIYSHKGDIVDGAWVPRATEEIIDISDLIPEDNYINVEGGGTVTMVNEYEYAVPSEITYALKEAE